MPGANARAVLGAIDIGDHAGIRWLATPPDQSATDGSATLWQVHIPVPPDHLWVVCPEERYTEGLPMAAVWPVRPRAADLLGSPHSAEPESWYTTMARSRRHARQLALKVCEAMAASMPDALSAQDVVRLLASRNSKVREWVLTRVLPHHSPAGPAAGAPTEAAGTM